ncbi:MAG: xanthine dehydrogenase family protein molybdopterin-binding subunit, partial [Nitrospinota bacterium]
RVLRAGRPHIRILRIDTGEAERLPGVAGVFTARDVPGRNRCGAVVADRPVLCEDVARYEGDALALVAAETPEAAAAGLDRIRVEHEDLPPLRNAGEARMPGAAPIHGDGNVFKEVHVAWGDAEAGFREAEAVVEETFRTHSQTHVYLETEAALSYRDEEGRLTVVATGQFPQFDRLQIAEALGLAEEAVRVVNPPNGGAFGGKEELTVQIYPALVTHLTGRPAKVVLDREESIVAGTKRHPMRFRYKAGLTAEGRLTALSVDIENETGPYLSYGHIITNVAVTHACGAYRVPHARLDAATVFTHGPFGGAFRSFGSSQPAFAVEVFADILAERAGLDPIEFRLRNCVRQGGKMVGDKELEISAPVRELLETARSHPLYAERDRIRAEQPDLPPGRRPACRTGVGVALSMKNFCMGSRVKDETRVEVRVDDAGRVVVESGITDIGTGNLTAIAQVVAEVLNCEVDRVRVLAGDSLSPDGGPTNASRTVYMGGSAAHRAATDLRDALLGRAAERADVPPERLYLEDGTVRGRPPTRLEIPWSELAREGPLAAAGFWKAAQFYGDDDWLPPYLFAFAVHLVQVAVDTATGEIDVQKVFAVLDPGRVINPLGVEGQSEGSVAMGMGCAFLEELVQRDGRHVNTSLADYLIPTALDVPEAQTAWVEAPEETSPVGAKGIAELPMNPFPPAFANALHHALGVRFLSTPITPEVILRAVRKKRTVVH